MSGWCNSAEEDTGVTKCQPIVVAIASPFAPPAVVRGPDSAYLVPVVPCTVVYYCLSIFELTNLVSERGRDSIEYASPNLRWVSEAGRESTG